MPQVFANRMVCHVWANQSQPEGRNAGRSLYFEPVGRIGSALYSYGPHFVLGAFVQWRANGPRLLLLNSKGRSMTTSKHQSYMRQALSTAQRESAVYVSGLDRSDLAQPVTIVRRLIDQARNDARNCVARRSAALARADMHSASRALQTAQRIRDAAGLKGERVPKMTHPGDLDDAGLRELARRFARDAIRADIATKLQNAEAQLAHDCTWPGQRTGCLTHAMQLLREALALANSAQLPAPRGAAKRLAELATVLADSRAADAEHARRDNLHKWRAAVLDWLTARRRDGAHLRWIVDRVASVGADAGLRNHVLTQRAARAIDWQAATAALTDARDWHRGMLAGNASVYAADASSALRRMAERVQRLNERARASFVRLHGAEVRTIQAACDEWRATQAQREAAVLADWLQGGARRPQLPHPVCRVMGDVVETTLGATVPLDHAQRLARLARRALREGQTCEGVRVGHFTVSRIDHGGALIGCHTFEASEMLRMLDVLDPQNSTEAYHA